MESNTDFDLKYIFNDNIERVWSFIRDPESLIKANKDLFVDIETIKGSNHWTVNSSFKIHRTTGVILHFICLESESQSHNKKLAYSCRIGDETEFKVSYTLYQISITNTTVVVIDFFDIKSTIPEHMKILQEITFPTYEKLNLYMQKSILSLFQNEGAIIHLNMEKLWNMIMDWNYAKQLTVVHVDAVIFLNQNTNVIQPGTEFKLIYCKENYAAFRIKTIDKKEGNNKIEFIIEYLTSSLFYFKELRIYLIAISENVTQISVCHHFSLPETPERIAQMSEIKRRTLTKLKKMAESLHQNAAMKESEK